jgi:hypothetical protein
MKNSLCLQGLCEKWWRLATVFRTFFDPDYARSAQK